MCTPKVYHARHGERTGHLEGAAESLAEQARQDERRNGRDAGHPVADLARLEVRRAAAVARRPDAHPNAHEVVGRILPDGLPTSHLDDTTQSGYTGGMGDRIQLPGEEWRSVVGFEGRYEISNLGRVRGLVRGSAGPPSRLLAPVRHPVGYLHVRLSPGSRRESSRHLIHRLVAAAFIGPCPDGWECNHKNGDKKDNKVENLEWCSHKDNMLHALNSGLRKSNCRRLMRNVLSENDVRRIHALYAQSNYDAPALAEMFGVTCEAIRRILIGNSWKHLDLPPVWRRDGISRKQKLTVEQREQVRRLYATGGYSQESLALAHGVSQQTVSRILRRLPENDNRFIEG